VETASGQYWVGTLQEIVHIPKLKMRWERQNKRWYNLCQRLVVMLA
jgi:hypothetical protein